MNNLNRNQREVFDRVMEAIATERGGNQAGVMAQGSKAFFLDGPGGTGKTFLENTLLATVRLLAAVPEQNLRGGIAIAMASAGIAAILLAGGTTAHSRLKLPLQADINSVLNLNAQDPRAKFICAADILIWDEAPMMDKHLMEALDRSLRDWMGSRLGEEWRKDVAFGGKVVLFSGDFRQILPVVRRGSRAQTVKASLKRSHLWPFVKKMKLTTNMRVARLQHQRQDDESIRRAEEFAELLLAIGEGRAGSPFRIPDHMCVPFNPE